MIICHGLTAWLEISGCMMLRKAPLQVHEGCTTGWFGETLRWQQHLVHFFQTMMPHIARPLVHWLKRDLGAFFKGTADEALWLQQKHTNHHYICSCELWYSILLHATNREPQASGIGPLKQIMCHFSHWLASRFYGFTPSLSSLSELDPHHKIDVHEKTSLK